MERLTRIPLSEGQGYAIISPEDGGRVKEETWHLLKSGYAESGKRILMHRFILQALEGSQIDHINGNKLDNRRSNLRFSTQAENMRNSSAQKNSTSKFKGVNWDTNQKKWTAQITINYKKHHLGVYTTEEEAARAYDSAALYYFKEFAHTNFDDGVPLPIDEIFRRNRSQQPFGSKYRGISRLNKSSNKWRAVISINNRQEFIGSFDSEEAAAHAYDKAAIELHGKNAKLNFPIQEVHP